MNHMQKNWDLEILTPRENEVLNLFMYVHTTKEVAKRLECSPRTVEVHRSRIIKKTNSKNLIDLMCRLHGYTDA
ncbi:LuxR C-terminal-related transcriptional regulator [Taylorella equigenitalis]|uniref:LuxR C-terminal-related transcriptional regulator n=2 Tax=Taylorella equigenitalis TaxID=29575 RepID=UPI00051D692E|nr:helix-turn-helix transcriptional regulator [Taylorella equigenitalis]ASY37269.1 helix-turn-helix transcriptional regulator [Taylorella equigenitalis]KGK33497.1 hypothetical protein LW90_03945 [Taylorella equigenitalis]WDU46557.1 helix-turn-helix transcriptional regulator [Taylorella equigenitalis]WDU48040.1 helix-turn-helix transcriptional regulator [Taylorella equigenitalis]WDU52026.1 helix-turn-helix transcriptional regulator [Taylorella equigenitalis]